MRPFRRLASALLLVGLVACGSTPSKPSNTPPPAPTDPSPDPDPPAGVDISPELKQVEQAISSGNPEKARALVEDALKKSPKDARALYYAGVAHEQLKLKEKAYEFYKAALQAQPAFAEAAINLAALYIDDKKGAEAVSALEPVVKKQPKDLLLLEAYAGALEAASNADGAVKAYKKLLAAGGQSFEAHINYAGLLVKQKQASDAIVVLKKALAIAGKDEQKLVLLGRGFAQAKDFDAAIAVMDEAYKLSPKASHLLFRALFKRSKKDLKGAQADMEEAIKQDPNMVAAHFYLGQVHEANKKKRAAKKAYQKAVKLAPESRYGKRAAERLKKL